MKILKFNESYQGNKVIKRYNNSILHEYDVEYNKIMEDLKSKKSEIIDLINEFITLNKGNFSNNYTIYPKIIDYLFYIDEDSKKPELGLFRDENYSNNVYLTLKDMNKLFDFLENPDLYRNANKYNL